jgi:hypothetical protein
VEFAACRGAGRRNDRRVMARNMATARAAKPAPSATSEPSEEPPESGETLATGLAPSACDEPGATEGNKLAALPPGLIVGVGNAKPDDGTLGSGDKLAPAGLPGARTATEDVAAGSTVRFAALPVTVRLTAVRVVAVSGTFTSAWNNRCAEVASTAPRSHAEVPLPLAQPKVKVGTPAPAVDCSWILASGTLPPSVQAPTSHWAACPRLLLCFRGTTPTHRLTGVVLAAAAWNAVSTMGRPATLFAAALVVDVSVGVGVVGSGVGVVGSGVGVVGSGVGVGVVGSGVGVVGSGVGVVGSGVGLVRVGAGVVGAGVVGAADGVPVAEADALGDVLTTFSGSQDSLSPGVVAAAALPLMAAIVLAEAALSRALPAIKVTARRRPCAIRISTNIVRYHRESNHLL